MEILDAICKWIHIFITDKKNVEYFLKLSVVLKLSMVVLRPFH